jgi:2,4-dienoyl-CoA reductase-like NADH-dependent reductase (Old Yellow Enzyme family)
MSPVRCQSEACDVSRLDRPLKFEFSGKTAKNRFLKAAMTERLSSWDPEDFKARGIPSQNLINVYKRWGAGVYGQILTGNIMIDYDQLEAMGNMIIPRESTFCGARFEAFRELAAAGNAHGSLVVGQVCHPGRQVGDIIQADPISASDIQLESSSRSYCYARLC